MPLKLPSKTAHWATRKIHSSHFGLFLVTISCEYSFVRTVSMAPFCFVLLEYIPHVVDCFPSWLASLFCGSFCGWLFETSYFNFWDFSFHFQYWFQSCFFLFLLLPFSLRLILSHGIFVLLVLEILWLHFSFSSIDFEFRFHLEVYDDWFKSGFFVLFFHSWIVNCLAISLGINFVRIIPWSNLF